MFGNIAGVKTYECKMTKMYKLINSHIVNIISYKGYFGNFDDQKRKPLLKAY